MFKKMKLMNDFLEPLGIKAYNISCQNKIDFENRKTNRIIKTIFNKKVSDIVEADLEEVKRLNCE